MVESLTASQVARPVDGVLAFALQVRDEVAAARRKAEPVPDGTVVRMRVSGTGSGLVEDAYVFAGVFAAGQWYFTGGGSLFPREMKHSTFVQKLATNRRILSVEFATAFEPLVVEGVS